MRQVVTQIIVACQQCGAELSEENVPVNIGWELRNYEIDLCSECGGRFDALVQAAVGPLFRSAAAPSYKPGKSVSQLTQPPKAKKEQAGDPHPCPHPECSAVPRSKGALEQHIRGHHREWQMEQWRAQGGGVECGVEGCTDYYPTVQGLGVHQRTAHGIKSKHAADVSSAIPGVSGQPASEVADVLAATGA